MQLQSATTLEPRIFRSRAIEARALLLSGNPQRCANLALGPHRVLRATCLKIAGYPIEIVEADDNRIRTVRIGRRVDEVAGVA